MKVYEHVEGSTLKNMIEEHTGKSNVQLFAIWAFGRPLTKDFYDPVAIRYWNHKHGWDLEVTEFFLDSRTVEKMVNIWRNTHEIKRHIRSLSNSE